ncbi:M10 family metallopeptidase C-terminal domain-containing protein [Pleurocapsales cyanobacterium LEGE 10410]|nr:M10 family metallopeptidase C-terminal domain-containing protein [Pleurocapsales cyanobacterium LEGE 10410]
MPLNNPTYYTGNTIKITEDDSSLSALFKGAGANVFADYLVEGIDKLKFSDVKESTLKFLTKNAAGNIVAKSFNIILNPNGKYTVVGEAADLAGATAVSIAVGGALAATVGAGASIMAAVAIVGTAAVGSTVLWNAIKEVDIVEDFFDNLNDTLDTNIELVDSEGNTVAGVFYEKGIDENDELQAVKQLLGRTILPDFPDVFIGTDFIRVIDDSKTGAFDKTRDSYKIYDGELVDIIASEFDIDRQDLLFLGVEDGPNINREIQYNNLINPEKFVFANSKNRFYVPLPNVASDGTQITGFHPGNIIYGDDSSNNLDVFEFTNRDLNNLNSDHLILGLNGNDTIYASTAKDFIFGGEGDDFINGNIGDDTVFFSDDFANYDYSIDDNGDITFTHARGTQADGTDTLRSIEQAQFKDRIVSLPLEEPQTEPESVSELEDDSVTFKFKTTLDESQSSTFIGLPPEIVGTNPEIELTYTFTPTQTRFGFTGLAPVPSTYNRVTGSLRINDQTTALDYGDIKVSDGKNNDGYNVSFIPKNDASLFGYDIGRIALDISDGSYFDNNGDFIQGGTIFNSISIPTDAKFANKDSLFFDLLITANAPRNEVENSIFVSVNERASSSERTPFTLSTVNSDDLSDESTEDEVSDNESTEEAPLDTPTNNSETDASDSKTVDTVESNDGNESSETSNNESLEANDPDTIEIPAEPSESGESDLPETPTSGVLVNSNQVIGTDDNDSPLNGTDNNDRIDGLAGNDDIFPGKGDDTIIGGLGSDYISLEAGKDVLLYNSTAESNILEDGNSADFLAGFTQGEDKIDLSALGFDSASDLIATQYTNDEGDTISEVYSRSKDGFSISFEGAYEFQTNDFIFDTADGSSQLDTLTGSENNDSPLYGSFGNDYIEALAGNDDIFAGSGDDTVVSGVGDDYLELGAGNDIIFVSSLDDSSNESGVDYVGDFVRGEDKIDVSALGFSDVDNFSIYQEDGYTEIYNGDFALGFDGDYTFSNSDFIFG